jgi:hypothetical protein
VEDVAFVVVVVDVIVNKAVDDVVVIANEMLVLDVYRIVDFSFLIETVTD